MKLAIVHDWLTGMRGGEKCLEVLCRRFPDARLYTLLHHRGRVSPSIEQMQITTSFLQHLPGGAGRHYRYLLPLMPRAISSLRIAADVDVVLSFSHAVAKAVRPPDGVPHVCYCFTPMRYAWHLRDEYFQPPEGMLIGRLAGVPLAAARNLVLNQLKQWDRNTSRRVTHFIAISQTIAARIADAYGRQSQIIYPPVDTDFYTPGDAAADRDDYYLCVSALVPYKRIELAVEACQRLRRRLVIIGSGPEEPRLRQLAHGDPNIRLLGWQSDETIRRHLRSCRALLFPGQEDFGIVPLEAQACGTAVIALGRGGANETVIAPQLTEPGTGLLFNEQTPTGLAAAMLELERKEEVFCPRLARANAQRFSTARYERELVEYLERVVQCEQYQAPVELHQ